MKLKTIESTYFEECGEAEVMFIDGKPVACWYGNDATWRHEYFERLMNAIGYTVKHVSKPSRAQRKAALAFLHYDE